MYKTKVTLKAVYGPKDSTKSVFTIQYFILQLPVLLILFSMIYSHVVGKEYLSSTFWIINSWASLLIWYRMIIYLQSTESMSFIISMIEQSFREMTAFTAILFMGVFAFADSIKSIRQILYQEQEMDHVVPMQDDPDSFSGMMNIWFGEWWAALQTTYYISLGGFDPEEIDKYNFMAWLIFLLCSIFNIIILLNLLIAIVSDIFSRVITEQVENRFHRMSKQISQCHRQFTWPNEGDFNKMLFIAKFERRRKAEYDQNKVILGIQNRLQKIEAQVMNYNEENTATLERIEKRLNMMPITRNTNSKARLGAALEVISET